MLKKNWTTLKTLCARRWDMYESMRKFIIIFVKIILVFTHFIWPYHRYIIILSGLDALSETETITFDTIQYALDDFRSSSFLANFFFGSIELSTIDKEKTDICTWIFNTINKTALHNLSPPINTHFCQTKEQEKNTIEEIDDQKFYCAVY